MCDTFIGSQKFLFCSVANISHERKMILFLAFLTLFCQLQGYDFLFGTHFCHHIFSLLRYFHVFIVRERTTNLQRIQKLTFDLLNTFFSYWERNPQFEVSYLSQKQCNNIIIYLISFFDFSGSCERWKKEKQRKNQYFLYGWEKRASEKNLTISWWNFALFYFLLQH